MARVSEEFGGKFPTEIFAEADRLPVGMLDQIIEDRYLARAIATFRANPTADGELIDLVKIVQFDLVQEEIDRKKRDAE